MDIITDDDTRMLQQLANPASNERTFGVLREMARKRIKLEDPNSKLTEIANGLGALEVFSCMARRLLAHRGVRP